MNRAERRAAAALAKKLAAPQKHRPPRQPGKPIRPCQQAGLGRLIHRAGLPDMWHGADITALETFADLIRADDDRKNNQAIELAGAMEIRRILEEIKAVAALQPFDASPTPYQAAWRGCCEEMFFRATGNHWHMEDDFGRFKEQVDG